MKKFKFTLQTVHNVREMHQEREQIALIQLQKEADELIENLANIEQMQLAAIADYTSKLRVGELMNVGEMELELKHIAALDNLKRENEILIKQKQTACDAQKRKLAAATREVKITNRLRETQQARHNSETARQEQIALDEIVSANYARRLI